VFFWGSLSLSLSLSLSPPMHPSLLCFLSYITSQVHQAID
jgi:hypothetical protein